MAFRAVVRSVAHPRVIDLVCCITAYTGRFAHQPDQAPLPPGVEERPG